MEIVVQLRDVQVDGQLDTHVRERMQFAIGQHEEQIDRVKVTLQDVNGPKGGRDKRCQVQVRLRPRGDVVVEELGDDLYAAASHAADRIKVAVARELERRRT